MKIKLIGCTSIVNEVLSLGVGDIQCSFLDFSFHAQPVKLHRRLQEIISASQEFDLIVLTYGRCSNAITGLISAKVPMLFPNTHDCIGLLLGSNDRHLAINKSNPYTYYLSQGWLDYGRNPFQEYQEYLKAYGKVKAYYLINQLYGNYKTLAFIETVGIRDLNTYMKRVFEIGNFFGWKVQKIQGDVKLLSSLVLGLPGNEIRYVEPGKEIEI